MLHCDSLVPRRPMTERLRQPKWQSVSPGGDGVWLDHGGVAREMLIGLFIAASRRRLWHQNTRFDCRTVCWYCCRIETAPFVLLAWSLLFGGQIVGKHNLGPSALGLAAIEALPLFQRCGVNFGRLREQSETGRTRAAKSWALLESPPWRCSEGERGRIWDTGTEYTGGSGSMPRQPVQVCRPPIVLARFEPLQDQP